MHKPTLLLTATAALTLCGCLMWAAHATSLMNTTSLWSRDFSPVEKIGCGKAGSDCPKGYQLDQYGRCKSCTTGELLYGPRHGDYGPRHYRDYDDRYYGPKRYPRGYY